MTKVIDALIKRDLATVRETSDKACTYRVNGDLGLGVFIIESGSQAINASDAPPAPPTAPAPKLPRITKTASVLALLQRDGATLAELIAATGWLPHTTRAALTGLRKKGHAIERSKRGDETCYRIPTAA